MENKNYSTVFEADLAYLRSLGDTSECKTEFEVRLKTLRKLGGDIQTTTPLLYEIEKKILDFLGGDSSLYENIYFIRKAIAEKQGVNTDGLHTIYAIAVASLNSEPVDIKYTITFKNYDGTILETQSLSLNEMPVYEGSTPVRESDGEYNYTFNGWLPEISPVSGNAEYVAQFEATAIPVNTNYVTFTAEQANSTIGLSQLSSNQTLEYSTDTTNWNTMDTSTNISLPNVGDKVYIRGILSANNSTSNYTQFKMTGKIAASGNCNAIWNYEDLEAPLKAYCGRTMFSRCTSLTAAPELPATTLADYCYSFMFNGCTSLTAAPVLPATTLANYCYYCMFQSCSSLITPPTLPSTTLANHCYDGMFISCTSLTAAPELPATTLANHCYYSMFRDCTSLVEAPELPATTLTMQCYRHMFSGCTSLVEAPELPATTLVDYCYNNMFNSCSNLNKITCLATDISASYCTSIWLSGVSSTGTFIKNPDMNDWTSGSNGIPSGWTVKNYGESDGPDLTLPYVTFTAEQANSTIGLSKLSTNQTLEYSTDTTNWNTMDTSTNISLPNTGDKVYIRGILSADNSSSYYTQFKMTGKVAASGNCNAIWNYEDLEAPLKAYCGYNLFKLCSSLVEAPELPASTLSNSCYSNMFVNCTSLTTAPELPATTLADSCYSSMFSGCSSLVNAPELPAKTIYRWCYNSMFKSCSSLVNAPELPATKLEERCYMQMFDGCKALTTAPELPATELANYCYSSMFSGCSSLVNAPSILYSSASYCCQNMFVNCTSLTTAPELPVTTLKSSCYYGMFKGCSKLNKITCLATNISASNCTKSWLSDVSSTGTFIKDPNMTAWTTGVDGIPDGWTVEDYVG